MLLISSASNPEVHLVLDFSNLGSFWLVLLSSQLLCWYHSVSYCLFLLLISLIILHFFHILSHYPMCYSKNFYSLQHLVFHYTLSAFKGVLFVAIWLWQPGTCPCILGMLGKRPSYEVPVSFIPLLSIYLFNIQHSFEESWILGCTATSVFILLLLYYYLKYLALKPAGQEVLWPIIIITGCLTACSGCCHCFNFFC